MKAATEQIIVIRRKENISIHAAREGGDSVDAHRRKHGMRFQSTPPVKAATREREEKETAVRISIHAAREGGDISGLTGVTANLISIHAAREGGDQECTLQSKHFKHFNPRRP